MKYRYSAYWHTWSRVLATNIKGGPILEVNLTPVPSSDRTWKNDVEPIIFRLHGTPLYHDDKEVEDLPEDVIKGMCDHLSIYLVAQLIYSDLLSEIDLDKLRANMKGGGVPLAEVKKGE